MTLGLAVRTALWLSVGSGVVSGVGLVSGVLGSSVRVGCGILSIVESGVRSWDGAGGGAESGFRRSLRVSCRTKCAGSRAININGHEAVCGLRGSSTCSGAKWDIKGSCSFKDGGHIGATTRSFCVHQQSINKQIISKHEACNLT